MKNTFRNISSILFVLVFLISFISTTTNRLFASQSKGEEIVAEAINRDTGFVNFQVDVEMFLENPNGEKSYRQIRNKVLEMENDGDKILIIFDKPSDVRGTALLSFTHLTENDDQWLYLPALKRVKRISSSNKSGSFMGSEFAFEDLPSEEIEKYNSYKLLKEEMCGTLSCFVVERIPIDKKSGYYRQIVWIDKTHYRFMKIEYYDRKNELLKTCNYNNYQLYLDQFWRSDEISMKNHQSGKSTKLVFNNYQFRTGLTNRDFDRNSLKRVR
jgi:outer membrane lipoprotein-sorting protein